MSDYCYFGLHFCQNVGSLFIDCRKGDTLGGAACVKYGARKDTDSASACMPKGCDEEEIRVKAYLVVCHQYASSGTKAGVGTQPNHVTATLRKKILDKRIISTICRSDSFVQEYLV